MYCTSVPPFILWIAACGVYQAPPAFTYTNPSAAGRAVHYSPDLRYLGGNRLRLSFDLAGTWTYCLLPQIVACRNHGRFIEMH